MKFETKITSKRWSRFFCVTWQTGEPAKWATYRFNAGFEIWAGRLVIEWWKR